MRTKITVRRIIFLCVILSASLAVFSGCEKSSRQQADLYEYFGFIDNAEDSDDKNPAQNPEAGADESGGGGQSGRTDGAVRPPEDQAALVFEGAVSDYRAILRDDHLYADIDAVQESIDKRFYRDVPGDMVLFTDAKSVLKSDCGDSVYTKDGVLKQLDFVISFVENEKCYVCLDFVAMFSDIDYKYYKGGEDVPPRVCVAVKSGKFTETTAKRKNTMRADQDLMADIVTKVDRKEKITVLERTGEWYKVQTKDGFIGFVRSKYYSGLSEKTVERDNDDDTYTHKAAGEKVKLVWHQVTNYDANAQLSALTENMRGVNVISPTWLKLKDSRGGIANISSAAYVKKAHAGNLSVWVLADDFDAGENGKRYVDTVLAYTSRREKLEDNLIGAVEKCGADGLNIDFEYISAANAENYLQFLRELSIKCKKHDLFLSTDNYAPATWSGYYDISEQGKLADYVVVMSYDEHNATSSEAGPVASLPFVKQSIQDTVKLAGDAGRVIMGVPFYTRVWEEIPEEYAPEGTDIKEDSVNGNYALDSTAVSMERAREICREVGVEPAWNEDAGTNYAYYEDGHSVYQIWLEDADSIAKKLDAANAAGLGGCACWKLGLEENEIWDLISAY